MNHENPIHIIHYPCADSLWHWVIGLYCFVLGGDWMSRNHVEFASKELAHAARQVREHYKMNGTADSEASFWGRAAGSAITEMLKLEAKIKTLEASASTLRVENMGLKADLEHFRRGKW